MLISLSALQPRSGKDTLADKLIDILPKTCKVAFADKLRATAGYVFNQSMVSATNFELCCNSKAKDTKFHYLAPRYVDHLQYRGMLFDKGFSLDEPMSCRQHLQLFGNDFIKDVMGLENHWMDCLRTTIQVRKDQGFEFIIITDARSPNEFDMVKAESGKTFLIERVGFPDDIHTNAPRHAVETHADNYNFDHRLHNHYGFPDVMVTQVKAYLGV